MPSSLDHLRIIIVDDQPSARGLLRSMLKDLHVHQVFEATDGSEAMAFIDNAADMIDLVICDWNMPKTAGIEVLRQMRGAGGAMPFLMVSGRADQSSVLEAKAAGVSGYLAKPYSCKQLEAKLRGLMRAARPAA
jgi:DNA-binding response OmpR family regulator